MEDVHRMIFILLNAIEEIEKENNELLSILSPDRRGSFTRGAAEKGLNVAFNIQTLLEHGQFVQWIPEKKAYGFTINFAHIRHKVKELYERSGKESVGSGTTVREISTDQAKTL